MEKLGKILWGLALVIVGAIWCLNAADITDIDVFFNGWWTLFIIVPCTISLITERKKFGSFIGLMIGVLLLLSANDVLDFGDVWKFVFPVIIILIGLKMIIGGSLFNHKLPVDSEITEDNKYYASFSGKNLDYTDRKVENIELTATFGGIKLDLRKAKLKSETVIKVSATFGGIDIFVPEDVNVIDNTTAIFGGVDTKKRHNKDAKKTIYITGSAVFGGVDIK